MLEIDVKKFITRARKLVSEDNRNPLERGARRRPKVDFLQTISELIVLLLDNLFTVSDQVYLLNSIDKKFSVSDTTYVKFLSENLKEEYEHFRKNRLFALNIRKIKNAIELYPASQLIQFSAVYGSNNSVSLEDYELFIRNYYSKSAKTFFEAHVVKKYDSKKRELVFDGECLRPTDIIEPAETFNDVVHLLCKDIDLSESVVARRKTSSSVKKENTPSDSAKARDENIIGDNKELLPTVLDDAVSSRNTKDKNGFSIYETHTHRDVLRDSEGDFRVGLIENANLNELKPSFKIIKNRSEFPQELINGHFLYADYNHSTMTLDEQFIYLADIEWIHFANPETYGLVDSLLFVCETVHSTKSGYMLYRYWRGDIYFIEQLKFPNGNMPFLIAIKKWADNNITAELQEFGFNYLRVRSGNYPIHKEV